MEIPKCPLTDEKKQMGQNLTMEYYSATKTNASESALMRWMGFPGGLDGKASACNAGDPDSIPGLGRSPGEGNGNPLQYPWPGKFHGQRSLVGCSSWGCKESGMKE